MLVQILRKADSFGQKQENRCIEFPRKVRSLCKLCTTSISPSNNLVWHKVCGFVFYILGDQIFGSVYSSFFGFDSTFDLIPYSASKTVKAWYRQSFHSKPLNNPAYRPGTLVCFIRGVKVLWTHVTLLGLARTSNSKKRTPSIYRLLNFCNQQTQFNKSTSSNVLSVWFFLLLES